MLTFACISFLFFDHMPSPRRTISIVTVSPTTPLEETREMQTALGQQDCCSLLTRLLSAYSESSVVCAAVCRAMAHLVGMAGGHQANIQQAFDSGCCPTVLVCLLRHLQVRR